MAIKTEMLRCFVAVADSGNLADAADRLGRTPSAVSMMLKQFEEHLGAPLFESERKSRLTELGAFVLGQARRELDHFDRTVEMIEAYAGSEAGFIRVAAVPSVGTVMLPKVLQRFHAARPGVRVDVRDMDSLSVLRELEKERIEIGLASGERAGADIEREKLFSDSFGIVCREDHFLVQRARPVAWDDITGLPFIANGTCSLIDDDVFRRVLERSTLSVRNTTTLFAMVRAGVGITVLPQLALDGAGGDIVFVPLVDASARRNIEMLCRVHTGLSPAAEAFREYVREVAAEVGVD